jgi:murein DD-endopeptidase MepM/ murein hydrolase activator NlpD
LRAEINAQKKEDAKITAEMAEILKQKQEQASLLEQMIDDLDYIYEQINQYHEEIVKAEEDYNQALKNFYTRARIMYKYTQYDSLQLFVEAEDIFDYANRDRLFSRMMENDRKALEDLVVMKQDLENKKKIQEQVKVDAEALVAEKQKVLEAIKNNEKIVAEELEASRGALAILESQEAKIEAESYKIEAEIKKLQELYNDYTQSYDGLIWPSRSSRRISSYYGMRLHPIYGYYKMHTGIDIGASYGTDIISSADGVVTNVIYNEGGYGWYIMVYHGDGITTLYAHCSKVIAKVGQNVKQGQVIALVGSTGASTGPHIHYEVRVNGAHTNPLNYVKP